MQKYLFNHPWSFRFSAAIISSVILTAWFSIAAPPEITSFSAPTEAGMLGPFDFSWDVTGEDVNLTISPVVRAVTGSSHTHTHPNQGKRVSTEITFTLTASTTTLYTRPDTNEGEWAEMAHIQATSGTTTLSTTLNGPSGLFRIGVEL